MHAANAYNMLVLCCIATPACLTVVAAPFFGGGVAGKTVLQDGGVERVRRTCEIGSRLFYIPITLILLEFSCAF